MKSSYYLLLPLILLLSLSLLGCSGLDEKRLVYLEAESLSPLQLPQGLSHPQGNEALALPQVSGVRTAPDPNPPAMELDSRDQTTSP